MIVEKNDYIEHEVKIQLMDCILEHNQEYQWFVYSIFIKIFNLKPNLISAKTDLLTDLLKLHSSLLGNWLGSMF